MLSIFCDLGSFFVCFLAPESFQALSIKPGIPNCHSYVA